MASQGTKVVCTDPDRLCGCKKLTAYDDGISLKYVEVLMEAASYERNRISQWTFKVNRQRSDGALRSASAEMR